MKTYASNAYGVVYLHLVIAMKHHFICQVSWFRRATWSLKTGHQVMHFAVRRRLVDPIRVRHLERIFWEACILLWKEERGWRLRRRRFFWRGWFLQRFWELSWKKTERGERRLSLDSKLKRDREYFVWGDFFLGWLRQRYFFRETVREGDSDG